MRHGIAAKSKIPAGKIVTKKVNVKETVASKLKGKGEQRTETKTVKPPGKTIIEITNFSLINFLSLLYEILSVQK